MSRREDRSSELKRYRSRFGRELSPKRSRRDDRRDGERTRVELESDKDRLDRDEKHRRRILDHDSGIRSNVSEGRTDGHIAGAKHGNDLTKVPKPRSYFQHVDRDRAGHNGRSFGRRTESDGWREAMEQQSDRRMNRTASVNLHRRDRDESGVWSFEMEANPKPLLPMQKRPSFREQKYPVKMNKALADHAESGNRDERGRRYGRPFAVEGGRDLNKGRRGSFQFQSVDSERGRDRYIPRQAHGGGEKWKHDLYDETNRIPTPKNEEDEILKIEALLAS